MNNLSLNVDSLTDKQIAMIVHAANSTEYDVVAKTSRWIVNAKSLLAMMALSHEAQPITIETEDTMVLEIISKLYK